MTETVTPPAAVTAPVAFTLPELTEVDPPVINVGRTKAPNPWIETVKSWAVDSNTGKSIKSKVFTLEKELAKVHVSAARRAVKEVHGDAGRTLSVDEKPSEDGKSSTVTLTIVPKRVMNKDKTAVTSPELAAPDLPGEATAPAVPTAPAKGTAK